VGRQTLLLSGVGDTCGADWRYMFAAKPHRDDSQLSVVTLSVAPETELADLQRLIDTYEAHLSFG
jgi:hypothetical protein